MASDRGRMGRISAWMHHHFLWLLIAAYVVAGVAPVPGLRLSGVTLGRLDFLGESLRLTMPTLLLGFLLFNAGLGVQVRQLGSLLSKPSLLLLGLAANLLVPTIFIYASSQCLRLWPDQVEAQTILLGLTLVAAMPIAGSSTAWSQRGSGDLALSLGLVLASTMLSPVTTPLVFQAVQPVLVADDAGVIQALGGAGTGLLLALFVMVPALCGVAVAELAGQARLTRLRSPLKLGSSLVLLMLVYANAAASLPETIAHPDPDFFALIVLTVLALCVTTFATGWAIGRWSGAGAARERALMFGLGMNNNGAGLVVASLLLAAHPLVMLPIILYNLVQHLVAAGASALVGEAILPIVAIRRCSPSVSRI
jgi:bile acid:Na+ symporter, BASS family